MALIKSEVRGKIRIVFFNEVRLVDGAAIEQCYREIIDLLDKSEESSLLLHFGRVQFLSSSALGILIRVKRKCMALKVVLKLCDIRPEIFEVFKITGLDKVFEIHRSAAEAVEAIEADDSLFLSKRRPSSYEVT